MTGVYLRDIPNTFFVVVSLHLNVSHLSSSRSWKSDCTETSLSKEC